MTRQTASNTSLRSWIGKALLLVGALVAIAELGPVVLPLWNALDNSLADSLESWDGLGMAALHLMQSVTAAHGALFSFGWKVLVSFTALGMMAAGLVVLQEKSVRAASSGAPMPVEGEQ